MSQLFDPFLSFHCFCPGAEFFDVKQLLGSMHFGVSCTLSFLVEFHARIYILCIACVESVSLAEDDVHIIGNASFALRFGTSV